MVRLLTISNPRAAQAFIDYLASRQIEVRMMPEGEGQFALWLLDEQHQVEVEAELQHFLSDPTDKKYQAASWTMAETRTSVFSYNTPSFIGMIKAKAGPVTLIGMSVCMVVFVLLQFGLQNRLFSLLHFPAEPSQQIQVWRWFTHAILHFSAMHIVFNVLWWWQLGGDIEKRLGSRKLLQLFAVSAALSGAGQYFVEGANFGGLSGVVYALVGYLWVIGTKVPQLGLSMPKPLIGFMLVWLVLGFVQPYMAIANTAHLVGLLSGVLVGLLDASNKKFRNMQ
ncbi:rhomboid family intramembrane serine protease GlpG [Vibrio genomosp. F10]|uniref:Rhomboid family intramembrane serine protease GlpG n=1 Tax=Vibrio genomosp. F10 str. ZF-129 TaxID=1187848 RepID=A0A1E5BID5_9VIBR|nr:rhomboid family intramembrane serine protease GlpG [Vibrio genomosp. F10]OEE36248.1 rhomboid family intramembrane serine protease GlpG [Vibrio genomosp. F10 str. ZF-129]OEF04233.1 rhomboid family intramembrane serine protease GlpG [Vibrio genomosp. F10 str. 9ZB36]